MDSINEAYKEQKKWEKQMGVGTLDKMAHVLSGGTIDYDEVDDLVQKPADHHIGGANSAKDGLLNLSMGILGQSKTDEIVKTASATEKPKMDSSLTPNQKKAISKYPSLVDVLGKDGIGDFIADKVGEAANQWVLNRIQKNSQLINKNAIDCKNDEGSIKQYFKYSNRAGFIKAAGKFAGDEFIHYDPEKNQGMVLHRKAKNQFVNVSDQFQIECNFVEAKIR